MKSHPSTFGDNEDLASKGVVLFDGECSFCNRTVSFIIDRDPAGYFRFAALKSGIGERLRHRFGIGDVDSIILIENDSAYLKSTAVLRIARRLASPWPALFLLKVVPAFARDFGYDLFARSRYSLFGRQNEMCRLPTPDLRRRFLDLT